MASLRYFLIAAFLLIVLSIASPHHNMLASQQPTGLDDNTAGMQSRTNIPVIVNNRQTRHPDAGVWAVYKGDNTAEDLRKPHIKGVMAYARWNELYLNENKFNWEHVERGLDLAINKAGKKGFLVMTAGYCPELEWPNFMRQKIASHRQENSNGCHPLQFWDPQYIKIYKEYIRALADFLADFDSSDARPNVTDITFIRAQAMADTMENIPRDYENWEAKDFRPAPNGRIYNVDLTEKIAYEYQREIVMYYKQELERAYQRKGLAPPVPVTKGARFGGETPNTDYFAENGIWFDKHSGSPNPEGWYYDMVSKVKSGQTRGASESHKNPPESYLSQYNLWESLATLHGGLEFIGIYGNNKKSPNLQPKGALGFAENREALQFISKYAGHARNPSASPGAWIGLRGAYPEDEWGNTLRHDTIWTNYNFLLTQHRPQDSVLMWSLNHNFDRVFRMVPVIRRDKKDPWADDLKFCREDYPEHECQFLLQRPDKYLGQSGGDHLFTYDNTNLGEVLYCGTDAFCQDRGKATRKEEMLWARRTNKQGGNNHMRFDLNDEFASSLGGRAEIRIVYLDKGTGKWELQYDSKSNAEKSAIVVEKNNTNIWKEVIVRLDDVKFRNGQEGGTDLSLYNKGDDDDTFHMIEVMRIGAGSATPPPTPTPAPLTELPTATAQPSAPTPGSPDLPPNATATPIPTQNPAPAPQADVQAFVETNGLVVMEAENFTKQRRGTERFSDVQWQPLSEIAGYSGSTALQAQPNLNHNTRADTSGPSLLYAIKFDTPGDYYVFVRGLGPASDSNSIHIGLNGQQILQGENGLGWPEDTQFSWRRGPGGAESRISIPEPGIYTINIWMREDGTIVDKVMLSLEGRAVNSGSRELGPAESERIVITDNNPPNNPPSGVEQTDRIWIPLVLN